MNYRYAEIMGDVNLGDAGTKIIDLNLIDSVSRFVVKFRPVGGSTDPLGHPVIAIQKIELVDGSDVLYNLTGMQGHGLNQIEYVNPVATYIDFRNGGTPMIDINMDFGRFLMDPELAFDPKKFVNPQLKITWDEDLWDASADSHGMAVWAYLFDEKAVSPIGFLMNKEIKAYTPVASAYEYTDIPTDHPLRMLILQGWDAENLPRVMIGAIKLSEDNDKRIPIDGNTYQLEPILKEFSGECKDHLFGHATTVQKFHYVTPSYIVHAGIVGRDAVNYYQIAANTGGRIQFVPLTDDKNFEAIVEGFFPHGCIPIKFGDQSKIEDWYDVTKVGSLVLRIQAEAGCGTGKTARIITQQLRRY